MTAAVRSVEAAACQVAPVLGRDGPAALNGGQFADEPEIFPKKVKAEPGEEALGTFLAEELIS